MKQYVTALSMTILKAQNAFAVGQVHFAAIPVTAHLSVLGLSGYFSNMIRFPLPMSHVEGFVGYRHHSNEFVKAVLQRSLDNTPACGFSQSAEWPANHQSFNFNVIARTETTVQDVADHIAKELMIQEMPILDAHKQDHRTELEMHLQEYVTDVQMFERHQTIKAALPDAKRLGNVPAPQYIVNAISVYPGMATLYPPEIWLINRVASNLDRRYVELASVYFGNIHPNGLVGTVLYTTEDSKELGKSRSAGVRSATGFFFRNDYLHVGGVCSNAGVDDPTLTVPQTQEIGYISLKGFPPTDFRVYLQQPKIDLEEIKRLAEFVVETTK